MKRYHTTYEEKQIVFAAVRIDSKAQRRGRSQFGRRAREAIEKAEEEFDIGDISPEIRKTIIEKIYQSIAYSQAWELLGETYCSRGMFYQYRKQFVYRIADNMGLIDSRRRDMFLRPAAGDGKR